MPRGHHAEHFVDSTQYPNTRESLGSNWTVRTNVSIQDFSVNDRDLYAILITKNLNENIKNNFKTMVSHYSDILYFDNSWNIVVQTNIDKSKNNISFMINWVFDGDVPKTDTITGEEERAFGLTITWKEKKRKTNPFNRWEDL